MADKAILLGINDYKNISDLRGCVNDVRNVERLLLDLYAFDESNIRVLTDSDVIYDNIVDSFTWLYTDANPDDRLLFHFSGHGSYTASDDSDEPVDELLCLWNMDWDDEDSYLVDDDLGKLTEDLPAGALLTVILDCCHSGTGTKAISGGPSHKPVRSISPKSRLVLPQDTVETLPVDEQDATRSMFKKSGVSLAPKTAFKPVFARFVYPPAEIRKDAPKLKPRSEKQPLNHLLLAAARDEQTAADAHIENEYQGAFTYYLCNAARQLGSTTSAMAIHDSAKAAIRNAGYSQTPQLEGVGSEARLFGGIASRMSSIELPEQVLPPITESASSEAIAPSNNLQAFSDLLRVHEKVLDLSATLLANAGLGREVGSSGSRSSTDEVIVYVHGISRHLAGYSNRWYSALSPHLGRSIPREEVLWSDIVNPRSLGAMADRSLTASGKDLKSAIEQEMSARKHNLQDSMPQETRVNLQQERGDGFSLDDFVRYMTVESTRSEILGRFDRIVRPLLSAGKKIHVVSHSWGTVVAYEGLRNLDAFPASGRVENLFVVGSALSISAVQWNLFGRLSDGRRPRHVRNLINLDATGDIVGGPISGKFSISAEHLGLKAINCRTVPFTDIPLSISCAHSSYFDADNVVVNRDVFADWINR